MATWTKDDIKTLRRLYPRYRTEEVADMLDRSVDAVKKFASRTGLRKTKKYLRDLREGKL